MASYLEANTWINAYGCRCQRGIPKGIFHEVDKDALDLLWAMKDHHGRQDPDAPLSDGTRVAPELVAERVGLAPDTLRYERTVRYLVREGALVWEECLGSVPGVDFYRITERGLQMMRSS